MMDLITGHQGVAHISAVQVATLNNKLTGDIGEHKVMRITGGTVTKNGLTLEIATGYWRVNGYDMEITEAETVYFDPSTVGLKRIDGVYVEILRDIASGVERAEIIVVKGEEGVSPVAPSAPTAPEYTTDILHQCELVGEVEVNENTMTLTDATIEYKISSGGAESLAPQFDENTSYSVGDVVEYDGKLYVFTSAHTGAWNASHVSETTVNALLANKADIPVSISQGGTGSTTAPQARSNLGAASDTTVGKIYNIIRQVSDDAYKTTKAYKAGDYVIYDDKLYKCTSACTAGSWATNSSHFTQDTLTNAVSQLNNDLNARHRRKRKQITAADLRACITADGVDLSIKDIVIGDYITINSNYTAVVADIDTFYGGYDSYAVVNTHHIGMLIVGKAGTITQKWNTSDSTASGYNGSALHTMLKGLISTIEGVLGTLVSHKKLLTTATSNWAWQTGQKISALSESQIYGAPIWSIDGYQQGEAWKQLEVFRKFSFNEIFGNQAVWLRSAQSASTACGAGYGGDAYRGGASAALGVVGLVLFH